MTGFDILCITLWIVAGGTGYKMHTMWSRRWAGRKEGRHRAS